MNNTRLTPLNVNAYVGYQILFKSRGKYMINEIIRASKSGKTITIDNPDLKNSLEIVSRRVYVLPKN